MIVNKAADRLEARGVSKNSRVAILLPNSMDYVILLLALWRIKAAACPLSTRFPHEKIKTLLKKISCPFLVTDGDRYSVSGVSSLTLNTISGNPRGRSPAFAGLRPRNGRGKPESQKSRIDLNAITTIILTSGSSGTPKVVCHSYANHYFNAIGSNENIKIESGDRWLLSLPLYHVGGVAILFRTLLSGATLVIPDENKDLAKMISRYQITHVSVVPTQLSRMLHNQKNIKHLRKLKAILIGGSPILKSLIQKSFHWGLKIYTTYGLTEMSSQVTTTQHQDSRAHLLTAGRLLPFRKIKISKTSEILVRGETLCRGYLKGKKISLPLHNSWFKTGDRGELTKDGYLRVLGRMDTMFVSGGENIYPEEIEAVLLHHPKIHSAMVVSMEDVEFGSRPCAFIKSHKKIDFQKLVDGLGRNLARFQIPDAFYAWPAKNFWGGLKFQRQDLIGILKSGRGNLLYSRQRTSK